MYYSRMNFIALTAIRPTQQMFSNANLDRFDEPFSSIVAPHESSAVKQLFMTYVPYNVLTMGNSRSARLALRISLFADFSMGNRSD